LAEAKTRNAKCGFQDIVFGRLPCFKKNAKNLPPLPTWSDCRYGYTWFIFNAIFPLVYMNCFCACENNNTIRT
uniref:Uncharacterized protein n=1 Tax=Ciona intestinalis TaxID=7719 RepID=H2XX65_CIOIN